MAPVVHDPLSPFAPPYPAIANDVVWRRQPIAVEPLNMLSVALEDRGPRSQPDTDHAMPTAANTGRVRQLEVDTLWWPRTNGGVILREAWLTGITDHLCTEVAVAHGDWWTDRGERWR